MDTDVISNNRIFHIFKTYIFTNIHISTLITTNHTWNDTTIPIKYNEVSKGKIVIKDDVWIGCGVRVLSNVTIKQRSVVAAGSIVVKDIFHNNRTCCHNRSLFDSHIT